jgi:type I restriction enzyme S subunit
MSAEWSSRQLDDVCDVFNGNSINEKRKAERYAGNCEGLPYIATKDVNFNTVVNYESGVRIPEVERAKFRVAPEGTVLVCAEGGSAGRKFALIDREVCFGNKLFALASKGDITPKFLFYSVLTESFRSQFRSAMSGLIGGVSLNKIRRFSLSVPPLPEQARIAAILDQAFESIGTAVANTETNEKNANALIESYIDSAISEMRAGWKMTRLGDLTHLARGHNPPKRTFSHKQKPGYVRFYQIRDGASDDRAVYVPDTPQLHKVKSDDIMVVAYRHVGRAFRGVEGAFNVALCKVSNVSRDVLDDDFLFHLVPSRFVKGELLKRSERSLIPSMSIEHLREMKVPVPPMHEQHRIVHSIATLKVEITRLTSLCQRKRAALDGLKQSLMHQAFTGKI